MSAQNTRVLPYGPEAIAEAARLIRAGEPVAMPTETVYGLAADATSGEAVARIYAAKGRPSFNPLIVHVPGIDEAREIAVLDAEAERLARAHWPGPLTLVLPLREGAPIASLVTAGLPTVAVRTTMLSVPPSGMASLAFRARFMTICSTWVGSAMTVSSAGSA